MMAPAMNGKMYLHAATQANMDKLKELGVHIVEPVEGELACGYDGTGKMAPVASIMKEVADFLQGSS